MLIDNTLSYWENKANIERQAHVKLRLRVRENHEEERRDIMGLLSERRRQDKEAYEEYVRSFGKNH